MGEAEVGAVSRTVVGRAPRAVGRGELVIQDFQTEMDVCKPGDNIESRPFKVKGNIFVIEVFPNGDREETRGTVVMGLRNWSDKEVTVNMYKVTIGEEIFEGEKNIVFKANNGTGGNGTGRGWDWCTQEECKSVLKNGALVVEAEVVVIGDRITIDTSAETQNKNSNWLLENIYKTKMSNSDFVLVCESEAIPCHKVVLSGASEYFEGLLKPNFKEYKDGCSSLPLKCSAKVGRNFVKFLYTNEIEEAVFDDNIEDFLKLADMLIMERLKQRAEQKMLQLLGLQNMVAFFIADAAFKADKIREAAKKFLQANLAWLLKQKDWGKAFGDLLDEVCGDQQ